MIWFALFELGNSVDLFIRRGMRFRFYLFELLLDDELWVFIVWCVVCFLGYVLTAFMCWLWFVCLLFCVMILLGLYWYLLGCLLVLLFTVGMYIGLDY